ncbi:MAG TPA: ABC transporter permease subunit [Solirubrobacterales bacterium]|nr:ABC transporter permease subunit [Solirubrobacterales bacterium]
MSAHPAATRAAPDLWTRIRGSESWSIGDRIGVGLAWGAGLLLCAIAVAIVLYMLVRGLQYLSLSDVFSHPLPGLGESGGGFLDPIIGTFIVAILGIVIAGPLGVAIAVWLTEYARPAWLARAVESGIEIVAGTPSIVLAIFGLIVFQQSFFSALSPTGEGATPLGRSFLIAGGMMSLLALPLVVGATREALHSIPRHVREASYSLGKDRASTIRRVLLPASRRGIGTGVTLGMGRIIGDTAIVFILLGATLRFEPNTGLPGWSLLTGNGSTLTTYVYNNSPAGEGGQPEKAYAAAFVLLAIVLALNFAVDLITRGKGKSWTR